MADFKTIYYSSIVFVLTLICTSTSLAQSLEYPKKDCQGASVTPEDLHSWCHDNVDDFYNECDCRFETAMKAYRAAQEKAQKKYIDAQGYTRDASRSASEAGFAASNLASGIEDSDNFEADKSSAEQLFQDGIAYYNEAIRHMKTEFNLCKELGHSSCKDRTPDLKSALSSLQDQLNDLRSATPRQELTLVLSSPSSSAYSNTSNEDYSANNSSNSGSLNSASTQEYNSTQGGTQSNDSTTGRSNSTESAYSMPTPEEIYTNARAEQIRQDAIADEFEADFMSAINADGSVNSYQAGLAVTKAVTNSTGNAQTGAIAGAVTTGVSLIAQGIAAKKARKEEEARLEAERLHRIAVEGIGEYNASGEKEGEWWFGYGHEDMKAKGSYNNGIQDGRWIYRKQGENDLTLVWYKMGKRLTSLRVYWFYDSSQQGYKDEDGKLWLTANSYYIKKGNRVSQMMGGRYVDGQRQGEFNFFYDNLSQAQRVQYTNNLLDGIAVGWRPVANNSKDSRLFAGEMSKGVKHGDWALYFGDVDKIAAEGQFQNDKREGVWSFYKPNGTLTSMVEFNNDLKNGQANIFYDDGQLKGSGEYTQGVPSGTWTFFHRPDKITSTTNKSDKKKKSIGHFAIRILVPHVMIADAVKKGGSKYQQTGAEAKTEDPSTPGPVMIEVNFENGLMNSTYTTYYDNGQIQEEGTLKDGQPIETWKYYDEDGNLLSEGEYASGKAVHEDFYFKVSPKDLTDKWNADFRANTLTSGLPLQEDIYKYRYDTNYDISDLSEGIRQGTWTIYYTNGQIEEVINYDEKGQKHGSFESFFENGNPKAIGEYYKDKKVGDWQNFKANGDAKTGILNKKKNKNKEALDLFKKNE